MGGLRKPFLEIANDPVLLHALRPFLAEPRVVRIAVALPQDLVLDAPSWLTELDERIVLVAGGATRGESVSAAIQALDDDVTVIAVHDAARPLVTIQTIGRCIDVAETGTGAVAGSPAIDTIKRVDDGVRIVGTPDRTHLWSAHTPQVFPAALLRRAYETAGLATDDSALVEALGEAVVMVDDGGWNLKVTRPEDVVVAEVLLASRTRS